MIKIYCLSFLLCSVFLGSAQADYKFYYEKAKTEAQANDYTNAIIDYSIAIGIDSSHIESYYNRAIAKLRMSDFVGAANNFTHIIEFSRKMASGKKLLRLPEGKYYANSYFYRAEAEFQMFNFKPAVKDYSKAIKNGIDSIGDAYNGRGRAKKRLDDYYKRDYFEAISDFDKGIQLEPFNAFGYYHRGTAEFNGKNYGAALIDITKAVQLDTTDADKYFWLGMAQTRLKNYNSAIINFTRSIQLNPARAREYEGRAHAELELGQTEAARTDLVKVASLKKHKPNISKSVPEFK